MIKKIIHCSDIHVRNVQRHEEYKIQLQKFIDECKDIVSQYEDGEVRVVIAGDIFHQKIQTSNEQTILMSWFLRELNKFVKTIIIAGNHDYMESNSERLDSITPMIKTLELENIIYLDLELGYKSGIYVDDNIVWCLYSVFEHFKIPDIKIERVNHKDKKFIGLFHGALAGSKTDSGFEFEHGISTSIFKGTDAVLCGDIHKRQELLIDETRVVYPGSLLQQDFGESVSKHGFLLWDTETLEYEEYDLPSDYGFYKFRIGSVKEVEEGTEDFINF